MKSKLYLVKRADRAIDARAIVPTDDELRAGDSVIEVPREYAHGTLQHLCDAKAQIHSEPHVVVANIRSIGLAFVIPERDLQHIPNEGQQLLTIALNIPARVLADLLRSLG